MSWRNWFSLTLLALSLGGVVGLQSQRLRVLQRQAEQPTMAQLQAAVQQERIRLEVLRSLPAFGFDNLLADWTLLQFFQYFGDDEARKMTGYELTLAYFAIVLQHKPRFREVYSIAATAGAMYAIQPRETDDLMTEGIAHMTPEIPYHAYTAVQNQAINQLLFLPNGGERAQPTFAKSAAWASIYDDEPSQAATVFAGGLAQTLKEDPKSDSVRIMAWATVLSSVTDEQSQRRAIAEIRALGGDVSIGDDGSLDLSFPETAGE